MLHLPASHRDGRPPLVQLTHERIYVGIDVGYRDHVAAATPVSAFNPKRQPDGWKRTRTLHFPSDAEGFARLQHYLDRHSLDPADFLILLEPTGGFYSYTLVLYLLGQRYAVLQVDNRTVKEYREKVYGSETKTDDGDARLMARMGFLHELVGEEFKIQPVHQADAEVAALRVMVRDLLKLSEEISRRRNQLQQVVALTFPELKTFFPSSTAVPTARRLIARFPTPELLAQASTEEVAAVLREAHAYRYAKRAAELRALAAASAGLRLSRTHQWRQQWLLGQLDTLQRAREDVLAEVRRTLVGHPYTPIIESLPGPHSAIWTATLIAIIGDVRRFDNYSQFRAYLGWYPQTAQSGSSLRSSRLANKGVRLGRRVLGQMAMLLVAPAAGNNPFRALHEQHIVRGMPRLNSIGHIAGKLAAVLYGLLKHGQLYDEDLHRRSLRLPPRDQARTSTAEVPLDTLDHLRAQDFDTPDEPRDGVALT